MSQDAEGLCLLKIKDIKPEDRGVYTAKATNQLGEAKCFSQLIVKTPVTLESLETQASQTQHMASEERPAFKELFSDIVVTEGSSAKFECIVTGKPTPKVNISIIFHDYLTLKKNCSIVLLLVNKLIKNFNLSGYIRKIYCHF